MKLKFETTHAPRVISTANKPTAVLNAQGQDALVAKLIAEYAPHARAKAVADRAAAKAKAEAARGPALTKLLADARALTAQLAGA